MSTPRSSRHDHPSGDADGKHAQTSDTPATKSRKRKTVGTPTTASSEALQPGRVDADVAAVSKVSKASLPADLVAKQSRSKAASEPSEKLTTKAATNSETNSATAKDAAAKTAPSVQGTKRAKVNASVVGRVAPAKDDVPWLPTAKPITLEGRGELKIYDIAGPKGAPVVMLIHGWTVTANLNYFRVYQELAKRYRVVAFDQRGHGQGIRPRHFFRLEDCADDCVAVADALGIDTFVVVGYSMGGTIAQLAARRHPSRVRGIVLCCTSKRFRSQGKERAIWEGSMGLAAAMLTLAPQPVRQQLLSRYLLVRKEDMPTWMVDEIRHNDPAMVAQAGLALGRYDATDWIGELGINAETGVRASVVITTKDQTVRTSHQRKLASSLSGASVHEVEADHRASVTNAELFVPALLAALSDVTD
jgi:3-oxoadipate enol-lactonase